MDIVTGTWSSPFLRGYSYTVIQLPDGQLYWQLLHLGERVNGGLAPDVLAAVLDAVAYARQHARGVMTITAAMLYCKRQKGSLDEHARMPRVPAAD